MYPFPDTHTGVGAYTDIHGDTLLCTDTYMDIDTDTERHTWTQPQIQKHTERHRYMHIHNKHKMTHRSTQTAIHRHNCAHTDTFPVPCL